jgi:hypothetical protein
MIAAHNLQAGLSMLARSSAAVVFTLLVTAACAPSPRSEVQVPAERYDNVQSFFERYDRDRDGMISRREAGEDPDLMLVFDKADANHDGLIDRIEFRKAARLAVDNRRHGAAAGFGE